MSAETATQGMAPQLSHATLLRLALDALAQRAIRVLALLMAFGLFVAAVWYPDWRRLSAAVAFSVIVLPMVWLRKETAGRG